MQVSSPKSSSQKILLTSLYFIGLVQLMLWACKKAYEIRLFAINEYGRVIHEFDPYFNYRATEYLWEHGARDFFHWFDYMVWYPLGRPVGTTIYPGMQFTSVFIKMFILPNWSINDICCFVPPWFGVLATLSVALLAYECSTSQEPFGSILNDVPIINVVYRNTLVPAVSFLKKLLVKLTGSTWGLDFTPQAGLECALFSGAIMAIIPAHLMRSIGGGYDNESIATTAMTLTFYLWTRSLRGTAPNYFWAVLSGVAYFYMVAAWGGYVFVLNLIGVHASLLVALGRYSTKLHRAYTLFYLVGMTLAIQVPVVGWTPLRSLEQMGPLLAFGGFQLIEFCEIVKRRRKLSTMDTWKLRVAVFSGAAIVAALFAYFVLGTSYFGPMSSRVRGLFVKHTKTGNPLVDSVAEHQPASKGAYFQYLQYIMYIAPVGLVFVSLFRMNDASSFLLVYGAAAYFFSHKMVRLILLTAPIASVLAGIALGNLWAWCLGSIVDTQPTLSQLFEDNSTEKERPTKETVSDGSKKRVQEAASSSDDSEKEEPEASSSTVDSKKKEPDAGLKDPRGDPLWVRAVRVVVSVYLVYRITPFAASFYKTSHHLGKQLSNPTIIIKAKTRDGQTVTVDDYREGYLWLRNNTPEDARIMAWWDYGYQIAGIANRTTIADGNTWNHEHIALLGKALTTNVEEGYQIARHLADYVLIWGGGGGDDLAKSPHLARIANSVYRDHCPGDPTCRAFGFVDRQGTPSAMMKRSFLFNLHSHKLRPGVEADPNRFQAVFRSKYGKIRIFKLLGVSEESKKWVADPANRLCDVPGSWFCPGQYPPGLSEILSKKKDFSQLEDFNREKGDKEYQKAYFEALNNPELAKKRALERELEERRMKGDATNDLSGELDQATTDQVYKTWENTEATTKMWQLINSNNVAVLQAWLERVPRVAYIRSKDGRGPMWWAFEAMNEEVVSLLTKAGVPTIDVDASGQTPLDLLRTRLRSQKMSQDEIDRIEAVWPGIKTTKEEIKVTFKNSGSSYDTAELYYNNEKLMAILGKNDPPASFRTYSGHTWDVKVNGDIVKSWTMSLEEGHVQTFTV